MVAWPKMRNLSLKNKLIVSFALVLFVTCVGISLTYYTYIRSVLRGTTIRDTSVNLGYLMDNVDARLQQCELLSDWILVNRGIERVLIRDYGATGPNTNRSLDLQTTYNQVYDHVLRTSINRYVLSIVIYGFNDVTIKVFEEADSISLNALVTSPWFYEGMNSGNRIIWPGIAKNLSYMVGAQREILPIIRPILFADTLKPIGFHSINFHPDLVRDVCARYGAAVTDPVLLVDRDGGLLFDNRGVMEFDTDEAARQAQEAGNSSGYYVTALSGIKKLVFYQQSARSGMTAYQIMDYSDFESRQTTVVTILIVILSSIPISILLTIFLSVRLTRPIEKIQHRMTQIALGDFTRDPALEGMDEIGQLGKGINDLATSVDSLLQNHLQEERDKKALELKLLQNQINPHFIYNALNAIRMMAMIQKSQGIYDTANALGTLLKETSKGSMEKITLREEFFLVEQFIHIHNIRKKGLIHTDYSLDEDIAECLIVRLLLQPIVENAIIHGFEGKRGICNLWISAKREGDNIRVMIRDNGSGMSAEQLDRVLNVDSQMAGERFNRVGIRNIQEQIRYIYGDGHGMTIESQPRMGTTVTIVIPVEGLQDTGGGK